MYVARNSLYATVVIKVTLQAKHLPFLTTPVYILNIWKKKNQDLFHKRTETGKKIWGKDPHNTHDLRRPKDNLLLLHEAAEKTVQNRTEEMTLEF